MSNAEVPGFIQRYVGTTHGLLDGITASDVNGPVPFAEAISIAVDLVRNAQDQGRKVMMVGNGGSAGIASHQAVDYWKNGNVRATAFNDASLLTCIGNDVGFAELFSTPIQRFADRGDLLFAISSSGASPNILNAADAGKASGCTTITFSGFDPGNPLRTKGELNFHVASHSYGMVEILHLFIIHLILDTKLHCFDGRDVFDGNAPKRS